MEGGSLYDRLGVAPWASPEQIRSAYRRLVLVRHPDHGGTPGSFQQLQDAYDTLSDPEARRAYDRARGGPSRSWLSGGHEDPGPATAMATWRRYTSKWLDAIRALPVLSGKERRHADFVIAAGLAGLVVTVVLVVILLKATHGLVLVVALVLAVALWHQRRAHSHALGAEQQGGAEPGGQSAEPPGPSGMAPSSGN